MNSKTQKENKDNLKAEFIKTGQELFFSKGYDKTSIQAIIDKVGVSKGAFYHYFKSKGDLLEEICDIFSFKMLKRMETMAKTPGLTALEKIKLTFTPEKVWKEYDKKSFIKNITKAIFSEENIVLRHKLTMRNIKIAIPFYKEIIEQGIKEGTLKTSNSELAAETMFVLIKNMKEFIVELLFEMPKHPENIDVIKEKVSFYADCIEKILGAPKGAIVLWDDKHTGKTVKWFAEDKK